jgi:hypothetical protein
MRQAPFLHEQFNAFSSIPPTKTSRSPQLHHISLDGAAGGEPISIERPGIDKLPTHLRKPHVTGLCTVPDR